jgi:hypothetical protein
MQSASVLTKFCLIVVVSGKTRMPKTPIHGRVSDAEHVLSNLNRPPLRHRPRDPPHTAHVYHTAVSPLSYPPLHAITTFAHTGDPTLPQLARTALPRTPRTTAHYLLHRATSGT